jgi:hypothetical protein
MAAAFWLVPLVELAMPLFAGDDARTSLPGILGKMLVNVVLFVALAEGRSWARSVTFILLGAAAVFSLLAPVLAPLATPGWVVPIASAVVYGSAAAVLHRSRDVKAYLDARSGRFAFPRR